MIIATLNDNVPESEDGDSDSERAAKKPRLDARPACDSNFANSLPPFRAVPGFQLHTGSSKFPTTPERCKPTNPLSIKHPEAAMPVVRDFLMRQQQAHAGCTMGREAQKTAALNTLMALLEGLGIKKRRSGALPECPCSWCKYRAASHCWQWL
jgi:hypothetical protein